MKGILGRWSLDDHFRKSWEDITKKIDKQITLIIYIEVKIPVEDHIEFDVCNLIKRKIYSGDL
jgi:hypothetical protein